MNGRTDRTQETRSAEQRKVSWQPPSILPNPTQHPDYVYRYIRKSTLGELDPTNVSKRYREGWEPARAEDHPELKLAVDVSAKDSGLIEIGGLVLCKMPRETAAARKEYYEEQAANQLRAVSTNQAFQNMAQPHPVMPLDPHGNRTEVSVGGRAKFGE